MAYTSNFIYKNDLLDKSLNHKITNNLNYDIGKYLIIDNKKLKTLDIKEPPQKVKWSKYKVTPNHPSNMYTEMIVKGEKYGVFIFNKKDKHNWDPNLLDLIKKTNIEGIWKETNSKIDFEKELLNDRDKNIIAYMFNISKSENIEDSVIIGRIIISFDTTKSLPRHLNENDWIQGKKCSDAYISNVDILNNYQGKGLCRPLLSYTIKYLKEQLGHTSLCIFNASFNLLPACYCYYKSAKENGFKVVASEPWDLSDTNEMNDNSCSEFDDFAIMFFNI